MQRPGHEINYPSPSGIEVKNEWSYTSISSVRLHGVGGENFTFFSFKHAIQSKRNYRIQIKRRNLYLTRTCCDHEWSIIS
jgi:hypothetical protein